MKLTEIFDFLLEKVNLIQQLINRPDFIAIMDVMHVKHASMGENCFTHAVGEAIKLTLNREDIDGDALEASIKKRTRADGGQYDSHKIHPDQVKGRHLVRTSNDTNTELHLSYKLVNSVEGIKSWLKKKTPVVLSVRWNSPYYLPGGWLRNSGSYYDESKLDKYESRGASPEMIEKVKNGIIPYPTEEFLNKNPGERDSTTHAILCIGYDAADHAFLVRDYLHTGAKYSGFFKIEEKCFFDPVLEKHGSSMVEAAIVVEVKKVTDNVPDDPKTSPDAFMKLLQAGLGKLNELKNIEDLKFDHNHEKITFRAEVVEDLWDAELELERLFSHNSKYAQALAKIGYSVSYVDVNRYGEVIIHLAD